MLSFANPWGLLGLLALPAILVLHLYQRRFPRMAVAGLHLWGIHAEAHDAGPKRERLPLTWSLFLELLAALLLTLVVSRPRFDATAKAEHLVVILDDSASMSSRPEGGVSFRDAAVEAIESRLAELPAGSVVTLLRTGRRPAMLAGPGVSPREAIEKLADWQPGEPRHDFQPAWDYAAQLADETGRLLFVTDRLPGGDDPSLPKKLGVLSVGRRCDNVAFTNARWTLQTIVAGKGRTLQAVVGHVFLWVHNFGEQPTSAEVRGAGDDGKEVFRRSLQLPARGGDKVDATVPGGIGRLKVELTSPRDELKLDSRLSMVEPQLRRVDVAITLPNESNARRYFERVLRLIPAVRIVKNISADLVIAPASKLPPSREDLWWLGVGPLDPSPAAKKKSLAPSATFPFLIERLHPVLKDVQLEGVRWAGVQPLKTPVTPLISAGGHVHLGQLKETETTGFILNVDMDVSTLHQSEDWPILLSNLIEQRRKSLPGLREWNYRQGRNVLFRLSPERAETAATYNKPLTLVHVADAASVGKAGPDGPSGPSSDGTHQFERLGASRSGRAVRTYPVTRSRLVEITAPERNGVYVIYDGDTQLGRFAVAFLDSRESDLSQLRPGRRPAEDDSTAAGFFVDQPFSPLHTALLVLALAAMIADWYVLRRGK
jgi:Aerotolerance regulator N-terminal